MDFLLLIFGIILIFVALKPQEVISRWHHAFDQEQFSSNECYTIIQECIEKRQIPSVKCYRFTFVVQGILTGKREYLRVTNGTYLFDICAAPYGNGFFISHWLKETKSVGEIILHRFLPFLGNKSAYQLDTETMFRETVHKAVLEAIEQISKPKGIRGLSELEKQMAVNPKLMFQVRSQA